MLEIYRVAVWLGSVNYRLALSVGNDFPLDSLTRAAVLAFPVGGGQLIAARRGINLYH